MEETEKKSVSTMDIVLTYTRDVQEASDVVLTKFEKPADQSYNEKKLRAKHGQCYYDMYT